MNKYQQEIKELINTEKQRKEIKGQSNCNAHLVLGISLIVKIIMKNLKRILGVEKFLSNN